MSEEKNTKNTALPSPVALVKESWEIYTEHILRFVTLMAIPFFVGMLVLGIFLALGWITGPSLTVGVIFSMLSVLLMILIQVWGQVAIMLGVIHVKEKQDIKAIYKNAWYVLGVFFGTSLLSALVIVGGMFLAILPGIFFGVLVSFSNFIVLKEKKSFFDALMQSARYVSGRWWSVFGRLLFLIAMAIIASDGTAWLFGLISPMIGDLISTAVSFALVPFFVLYAYKLYTSLKDSYHASEESRSISRPWFVGLATFGLLAPLAMILLVVFLR